MRLITGWSDGMLVCALVMSAFPKFACCVSIQLPGELGENDLQTRVGSHYIQQNEGDSPISDFLFIAFKNRAYVR
ncbi:hypothetical protein GGR57DRAFT_469841 [Xylariaceae sp. FL1272]|nr:hypothetical protein GGR57DRAFT_469841 [Xylariaceae sp. FL1272]